MTTSRSRYPRVAKWTSTFRYLVFFQWIVTSWLTEQNFGTFPSPEIISTAHKIYGFQPTILKSISLMNCTQIKTDHASVPALSSLNLFSFRFSYFSFCWVCCCAITMGAAGWLKVVIHRNRRLFLPVAMSGPRPAHPLHPALSHKTAVSLLTLTYTVPSISINVRCILRRLVNKIFSFHSFQWEPLRASKLDSVVSH